MLRRAEPCPGLNSPWNGGPPLEQKTSAPIGSGACQMWVGLRVTVDLQEGQLSRESQEGKSGGGGQGIPRWERSLSKFRL